MLLLLGAHTSREASYSHRCRRASRRRPSPSLADTLPGAGEFPNLGNRWRFFAAEISGPAQPKLRIRVVAGKEPIMRHIVLGPRSLVLSFFALLLAGTAFAQESSAPALVIQPGTILTIRINEGLSSEQNQPGDFFSGTLVQPVVVRGIVVAQRG